MAQQNIKPALEEDTVLLKINYIVLLHVFYKKCIKRTHNGKKSLVCCIANRVQWLNLRAVRKNLLPAQQARSDAQFRIGVLYRKLNS
jgi:hypothetical protein